MAKIVLCLMLVLTIAFLFTIAQGLPTPDEERYLDKEYNRDIINWLNALQYPAPYNNPCKYYIDNGLGVPMSKRNSELINSLLSLPKSMNDAGK